MSFSEIRAYSSTTGKAVTKTIIMSSIEQFKIFASRTSNKMREE